MTVLITETTAKRAAMFRLGEDGTFIPIELTPKARAAVEMMAIVERCQRPPPRPRRAAVGHRHCRPYRAGDNRRPGLIRPHGLHRHRRYGQHRLAPMEHLAARQGQNQILTTSQTLEALDERGSAFATELHGEETPRGKSQPIKLYSLRAAELVPVDLMQPAHRQP